MNPSVSKSYRLNVTVSILLICIMVLTSMVASARQFRSAKPIATPAATTFQLPEGARPVDEIVPLSREQVTPALNEVIEAWNGAALEQTLSDDFYDASRLNYALDNIAPRNARLELQSIEGVQTLQQYIEDDPDRAGRERLVNRVSVTARTQIEFENAQGAFQRRSGVNEYLLKITFPDGP